MRQNQDARSIKRRHVIGAIGTAGIGALAGCAGAGVGENTDQQDGADTEVGEDVPYEVWALDQGADIGYVYEPAENGFEQSSTIDFGTRLSNNHGHDDGHDDGHGDDHDDHDDDQGHEHSGLAPHMIDFSSDFEYAVVALHHGDGVAIVRTADREIVATVPTGHHSHFAAFAPDDEYITVDAVDDNAIRKVAADLATETFEIVDEIVLTEEAGEAFDGRDPTCHYYTGTGYTYHSLGPSYHDGGLAIVDHDAFELVEAHTADEIAANCGVFPHPEENVVYLTAGLPSDPESDTDGVGEYFVMDAETHEVIHNEETRGVDAHGLWITPDGEELWITNRESNNGVIVDTDTHEIVEEIEQYGPEAGDAPANSDAPDILAASPDGAYMFATARGPNPVTADPQAATGVTPGFFVLDTDSRGHLETIQPDPDDPNSDFHGIGVRPLTAFDGHTAPPVNTAEER